MTTSWWAGQTQIVILFGWGSRKTPWQQEVSFWSIFFLVQPRVSALISQEKGQRSGLMWCRSIKEPNPEHMAKHSHIFACPPFFSWTEVITSQPLEVQGSQFRMMTILLSTLPQSLRCCMGMESSVRVSMLTLSLSQSIQTQLVEIRSTTEQSINKWSAVSTLLHLTTLGKKYSQHQNALSATNDDNDLVQN